MPKRSIFARTLSRPGRKLARTLYALGPSLRSRLAGCIWPVPIGTAASTPPSAINTAIAVLERTPARSAIAHVSPPAQNGLTTTKTTIPIMASVGTSFIMR